MFCDADVLVSERYQKHRITAERNGHRVTTAKLVTSAIINTLVYDYSYDEMILHEHNFNH